MGTPVDKDVTLRNAAKHVKWGQGMGNIDWQVSGEERSRENLVLVLVNTETVLVDCVAGENSAILVVLGRVKGQFYR